MDDMEKYEREIARMRAYLRAKFGIAPDDGKGIMITFCGGLLPEPVIAIADGVHTLVRNAYGTGEESLESFSTRAATWAHELGAKTLLLTSMPSNCDIQREAVKRAHTWWLDNEYPEVPPCEEIGSRHAVRSGGGLINR